MTTIHRLLQDLVFHVRRVAYAMHMAAETLKAKHPVLDHPELTKGKIRMTMSAVDQ